MKNKNAEVSGTNVIVLIYMTSVKIVCYTITRGKANPYNIRW